MNDGVVLEEYVVISGKGGTGKTSLTASFAAMTSGAVLADCDVDAADLHLILEPTPVAKGDFTSGHEAFIRQDDCIKCGACLAVCRFDAVDMDGTAAGRSTFSINHLACEGCGACVHACPVDAIDFPEQVCGEWYVSDTVYGTMSRARLGVSGENSGRLVTLVRQKARELAKRNGVSTILIDGPPGIGCPVIASVTGATKVLIVTEPTCSGEHDMRRVLELAKHFGVGIGVCVNKWDVNGEVTERMEAIAVEAGATIVGRVRYAKEVTTAQLAAKPVVSIDCPVADDVREVWNNFLAL